MNKRIAAISPSLSPRDTPAVIANQLLEAACCNNHNAVLALCTAVRDQSPESLCAVQNTLANNLSAVISDISGSLSGAILQRFLLDEDLIPPPICIRNLELPQTPELLIDALDQAAASSVPLDNIISFVQASTVTLQDRKYHGGELERVALCTLFEIPMDQINEIIPAYGHPNQRPQGHPALLHRPDPTGTAGGDHYNYVTADGTVLEVPGDGNCFYTALSLLIQERTKMDRDSGSPYPLAELAPLSTQELRSLCALSVVHQPDTGPQSEMFGLASTPL